MRESFIGKTFMIFILTDIPFLFVLDHLDDRSTHFMKIRQLRFDHRRLIKVFWSICNYQLNVSWVHGIFEAGLRNH